jgi:hypothetical protein
LNTNRIPNNSHRSHCFVKNVPASIQRWNFFFFEISVLRLYRLESVLGRVNMQMFATRNPWKCSRHYDNVFVLSHFYFLYWGGGSGNKGCGAPLRHSLTSRAEPAKYKRQYSGKPTPTILCVYFSSLQSGNAAEIYIYIVLKINVIIYTLNNLKNIYNKKLNSIFDHK